MSSWFTTLSGLSKTPKHITNVASALGFGRSAAAENKINADIIDLLEQDQEEQEPPKKIPLQPATEPSAYDPDRDITIDKSNEVNTQQDVGDVNAAAYYARETIAAMAAADAAEARAAATVVKRTADEAKAASATKATKAKAAPATKATEAKAVNLKRRHTGSAAPADIESKLEELKQLSVDFSTEAAETLNFSIGEVETGIRGIDSPEKEKEFAVNVEKISVLLATTIDKFGPDPSKQVFPSSPSNPAVLEQIRALVRDSIPISERGTALHATLTDPQLKRLAGYIILKYKAEQVNKSTVDPTELPYNGIPFDTPLGQPSQLQICFLPEEKTLLEQKGFVQARLDSVSCARGEEIMLVREQRAFVSANPEIDSMCEQCVFNFPPTSPYRRRLTAEHFFSRSRSRMEGDLAEANADPTTGINEAAGLCAFAYGGPSPPTDFRVISPTPGNLAFGKPPPLPVAEGAPIPPDGEPYAALYEFTNKVGPRVSIPYIPANYPPNPYPDPDWSAPFPSVMIGRKKLLYSIGPILFDNHLFGRPLIMIRLHNYKTAQHPDGIYFWVYPSFSESGLARVYFTIDGGMILKGIDYTLTTFVLEFLQVEINKYYFRHYLSKQPNNFFPTKLTSILQILDFFGEMIHLQDQWVYDFLCGLGKITSPYIRDHAPIPPDFNRHCYVFYSNPLLDIAPPGCPPFYPEDQSSLHLVALPEGAPRYTPTSIRRLRQCVSSGIELGEIKQERVRTRREREICASFMEMNAKYRGDTGEFTFPLRLCLSTTMDKIIVPDPNGGVAKPENFLPDGIFSDWPLTQWAQGCRDLGRCSLSPVIVTIAGVTPRLKDLVYNQHFEDGQFPKILTKQYSASRLVTVSETHGPDQQFQFRRALRSGADFNPDVDLITLDPDIYPPGGFVTIDDLAKIEKFNLLPRAIQTSVERMVDLFCNSEPEYYYVRESFLNLLGIPGHVEEDPLRRLIETAAKTAATAKTAAARTAAVTARTKLLTALKIHILTISVDNVNHALLQLRTDSPLDVIKKTMEITGVYRYSIASSIFDSFLGIPGFQLIPPADGFPAGEEVTCCYLDKLGQYRPMTFPLGTNPLSRDFSACFLQPDFDPYIIDSERSSESIHPSYLKEQLLGRDIKQSELNGLIDIVRAKAKINTSKVFSKMFLLRLLFNNGGRKIQVVVSVSSTITIAGGTRKYVPFATDLQFTPTFIGPVEGDGVGETLETIIATAVRYISAGCSVATKPAEYSQLSGYSQYLKFLEIYFRHFSTTCFTYDCTQIGPFNCLHDPMLKFLTSVFSDTPANKLAIAEINAKWNWIPYLRQCCGFDLDAESATKGQTLAQNIAFMLRINRPRMLKVCEILIDPMLERLADFDRGRVDRGGPDDDGDSGYESSSGSDSDDGSSMGDSPPSDTAWQQILAGQSLSQSSHVSDKTYHPSLTPSPSPSVSPIPVGDPSHVPLGPFSTSVDPQPPTKVSKAGGGSLTNKKYTKRNSIKRKPTRKNLKFTIIIKKNNTKYKTYKRKANGGKLRSNKHKNNKTMRRMRCVRK